MLNFNLRLDTMHQAIGQVSQRLEALQIEIEARGEISDANRACLDHIQQHQHKLAMRLAVAERQGTWVSLSKEFAMDWNLLLDDLDALEERIYD